MAVGEAVSEGIGGGVEVEVIEVVGETGGRPPGVPEILGVTVGDGQGIGVKLTAGVGEGGMPVRAKALSAKSRFSCGIKADEL